MKLLSCYLTNLNLNIRKINIKHSNPLIFNYYALKNHFNKRFDIIFDPKLARPSEPLDELLNFMLLNMENNEEDFNIIGQYLFIYKKYYLSQIIQTPIYFQSINLQDIIPEALLSYMMYSVKSIKWKKFYIIHSNEIIEMLFLCLWLKNINLFVRWIRKYFERNNLKRHKKLFLLFKYLLGNFIWNYNLFFQLRGLRFILRGKFGKAGSVRKTRKYIKRGKCSYSSKKLALVHKTTVIRTTTGTFSIKLEIFF